jgi:DNA-binding IclR family transcriptional regulator
MRVPPALETLAAATGETAHLAELRGRSVIYPVNRYPDKTLRVQTETGGVEAAHSTAVGKALLVGLTDQEVRVLYEGVDLQRFTERTVDSVETLLAELDRVRSGGCTADTGEQTPGTGCLAAPVRDARGMVVAAVGISGPESRVFADGEGPGEAVLACAAEIEKILAE